MYDLEKLFPSLTIFSDLDWEAVTKEYESTSIDLSFPEYLQKKALEGDCPPWLFELAYYELAAFNTQTSDGPFPHEPGVYLNPTALFLSLQYDISRMISEAQNGKVEVYEKEHVLCLYRDKNDTVSAMELDELELRLLQHLEDGPRPDICFVDKEHRQRFNELVQKGLVLELNT